MHAGLTSKIARLPAFLVALASLALLVATLAVERPSSTARLALSGDAHRIGVSTVAAVPAVEAVPRTGAKAPPRSGGDDPAAVPPALSELIFQAGVHAAPALADVATGRLRTGPPLGPRAPPHTV